MSFTRGHEKLAEFDLLRFPNVLFFAFIYVVSRIPLLNLGFGLDADAWRIANTAFDIRHHLVYHASRFPGYPVPEFINALVIDFGWLATNSLTALVSTISIIVFARILRTLRYRYQGFVLITYAFMPIIWINSTNTMDYMWSLLFIVLAWFFVLRNKWIVAGLMIGLAAGSRAQSLIFIIPFLFLILSKARNIMAAVTFLCCVVATTILIYSPLFLTYGWGFIQRYPTQTSLIQTGYQAIKLFGLPGITASLVLLISSLSNLRRMLVERNENDIFIMLSLVVSLILFAFVPYHLEYLIPAIPFVLLILCRLERKTLLVVSSLLLLAHSFVAIGSFKHTDGGEIRAQIVDHGAIVKNMMARQNQIDYTYALMSTEIDNRSIVIVGPWLPILAYQDKNLSSTQQSKMMYDCNVPTEGVQNFQRNILYRYLLDQAGLRQFLEQGYSIYYITGIREYTKTVYGYDLADYPARYLPI
ncbi:hypothetical protein AMJ87_00405 [candidate division WOR_3 bacterium SM23_60]|uniref:Glycosyltransferase RgtA/B/C/D-like domain-containing protein n=1 Tax=candidate division WOR_3 bacterium SM23_60 TaxID=1703780 RepID=A0A0S8GN81_UNCW3|nr:MAG: hypothetical protein AMJ87_00405 [candidate division WOR_3 bacterium SM23_60]